MAKKRLNKTFLFAGLGVLLLLAAGGAAVFILSKTPPAENVRRAQELADQGKFEDSLIEYGKALSKSQTDPKLWTEYGNALARTVADDETGATFASVRNAYTQALLIDPTYVPAMRKQLDLLTASADNFGTDAAGYGELHDLATRMVAADPNDQGAVTTAATSTIQQTMQPGVEVPRDEVDAAVASLQKQLDAGSADPDVPYFIALAKLDRANKLRGAGKSDDADKLAAEAQALADAQAKAHPKDAGQLFRAAQVLEQAGQYEGDRADQGQKDARAARVKQLVTDAAADADRKRDGVLYDTIILTAASQATRAGRADEAERAYRALLKEKPYDVTAKVALANLLAQRGAEGRDDAIKLLADKPELPDGLPPVDALRQQQGDLDRIATLAEQRINAAVALDLASSGAAMGSTRPADPAADAARRKALLADAEDNVRALQLKLQENPAVLRLSGELSRARGNNVEALQTLSKALSIVGEADQPSQRRLRYQIMYGLAQTDLAMGMGGEARRLLVQLAAPDGANFSPARRMLIGQLLKERDFDAARAQIDLLAKQEPNDPSTLALKLAAYADDPKQLDAQLAAIPEGTEPQRRLKLQLAVMNPAVRKSDAALALAKRMSDAAPGDEAVARAYVAMLLDRQEKDRAVVVLQRVVATNPNAQGSKQLLETLAKSPEELQKMGDAQIAKLPEFEQLLTRARIAAARGQSDEALGYLNKAVASDQADGRASAMLFNYYLAKGQPEESAKFLPALKKKNLDHVGGRTYDVRLLAAQGKRDEALIAARSLVKDYGELAESWLALGQAYQASDNPGQAAEAFLHVVQDQPTNVDALRGLVQSYIATGRPDEAKRYIDQGARVAPDDPTFKTLVLNWQMQFGDPQQAIAPLEKAVQNVPDNVENWGMLGAAYLRAYQQARESNPDQSKQFAAKGLDTAARAAERFPTNPRIVALLADFSNATGDPARGEQVLRKLAALPQYAGDPEVHSMLARYLLGAGKTDEAVGVFESFVKANPKNATMRVNLADLQQKLGRPEPALAAVPADDADPAVRAKRIQLLSQLNRAAEASALVDKALVKSRTPAMLDLAAMVALQSGEKDKAQKYVDEALRQSPNDPQALMRRAQVRLSQTPPDYAGAAADLTAVRSARPDDLNARVLLAQVQAQMGNLSAASDELETALKAQPRDVRLRLALADLYANQSPPKFSDAERVLRQAEQDPSLGLGKDPQIAAKQAVIFRAEGKADQAVAAAKRAVKLAPSNPAYFSGLLDILLGVGQNDAVLGATDAMAKAGQAEWWMLMARGTAQAQAKRPEAAMAEYAAAVKVATDANLSNAVGQVAAKASQTLGPDRGVSLIEPLVKSDPQWKLRAAQLYQAADDSDKAADLVRQVIDSPGVPPQTRDSALMTLGTIDLTSIPPRIDRAIESFRRVAKSRPDDLGVLNNLADALATPGPTSDPAEALKYSRRAYDLVRGRDSPPPAVIDTHGWVLVLNGQVPEGLDLLKQAADAQPQPAILYHLGEAYLRNQQQGQAIDALQKASAALDQSERAGRPADPAMRQRIQAALDNARNAPADGG